MTEWLADRPQVSVLSTEEHPHSFEDPPWTWYLFEVIARPLPEWPATDLGFPNKAGPEIHSSQDTVSSPDVPSVFDSLPDVVDPRATVDPNAPKQAGGGGFALLVLGLLWLWDSQKTKSSRR